MVEPDEILQKKELTGREQYIKDGLNFCLFLAFLVVDYFLLFFYTLCNITYPKKNSMIKFGGRLKTR